MHSGMSNTPIQRMMDTCLDQKPERVGHIVVDDLKKDLFADFSAIPSVPPQDSVLLEKEHLRVFLRIRPFSTAEDAGGESQECVSIEPPDTVFLKAPRCSLSTRRQTSHSDGDKPVTQTAQKFQFTRVYGPETTQREMFDGSVRRLVRDVLEGGNSLVFTYGVTNAGKTFTFLGREADGGILPRSLNIIFKSIEGRVYAHNNIKPLRCRDFTRLTKDQQDEETTNKRNLMRLSKESDFPKSSNNSTCRSIMLDGSSLCDISDQGDEDSFSLDVVSHMKYSVWVSFCEIYNENIHDLLEPVPNGSHRRTVLRLSQDIKGNSFVKDLKWVQVNNTEEAYKVMKIGKKNQSFSSTKLNNVSSRSHSIFSIRILRIEDGGVPRVHVISELSLCDLAGSERCAKTQNKGVLLKEAGNINTSLLILGKCLNALRLNQQAKFQQHVPFRESKLTHYLQGFFCGRGKACMIVNINQCASMYDETLNVLKFSAVAQKVVVLNIKPVPVIAPKRSARDVSLIINNSDRANVWSRRKSSMVAWETTLEDVQEDEDDDEEEMDDDDDDEEEDDDEGCDESIAEDTILEAGEEDKTTLEEEFNNDHFALVEELREKLIKEEAEKLALESCIRDEVTAEFMELFSKMECDYNERLSKEREIIEDRAEKRLEILKSLVCKSIGECANVSSAEDIPTKDKVLLLEGIIDAMRGDLTRIRRDAEAAQTCLVNLPPSPHTVADLRKQVGDLSAELLLAQQKVNLKTTEMDGMSMKMNQLELEQANDRALLASTKDEILNLKQNCTCVIQGSPRFDGRGKRSAAVLGDHDGQPALKKGNFEDERGVWADKLEKLQAEGDQKDMIVSQFKEERDALVRKVEMADKEIQNRCADAEEMARERVSFEQTVQKLTNDLLEQTDNCEAAMVSLESERKETARLSKDNKALVNGIFQLQQTSQKAETSLQTLRTEFAEQTVRSDKLLEELEAARALRKCLDEESNQKSQTIQSMTLETEQLRQEVEQLGQEVEKLKVASAQRNDSKFVNIIDAMKKECQSAVERSLHKSQQIAQLELELSQVREQLSAQEELCNQLRNELDAQINLRGSEIEKCHSDLQVATGHMKDQIANLEAQLQVSESSCVRVVELEKQLAEKEDCYRALKNQLHETQQKLSYMGENKVVEDMCPVLQKYPDSMKNSQVTIDCTGEDRPVKKLFSEKSLKETLSKQPSEMDDCSGDSLSLVEGLKLEMQKLLERNTEEKQKSWDLKEHSNIQPPEALDSSEVSTNRRGRDCCFPKPELESPFTPLAPNQIKLVRRTRTARKRKSSEVEDSVGSENKINIKVRGNNRENLQSSAQHDQKKRGTPSLKARKDGTLQKIGDFIQSSPILLGSKAKTIMEIVSGRSSDRGKVAAVKPKRTKRKLYKTDISSPMDIRSPQVFGLDQDVKESDHLIIKRQLRSRTARK
ncbi:hypothetical protein DPEC_G00329550 [Dallia pectoralis]|uniref:Uncharacterized protein n=1 Tax=Dallia pectoralis TaxID=75939 RepID=A0ACC2F8R6_DALPE|nr:hypothetical protein DPEC_G00329550 [Dallia pectoralis]